MVYITVAYLIAESDSLAVFIKVGTFHIVVVEISYNSFSVVVLTCCLVGIHEFVVAPAHCCTGISFRHTEFYMVTGIVKTAGYVNTSVTVRIEDVFVLCDKLRRHICIFVVKRKLCIVYVAVVTPCVSCVFAYFSSAHVCIVEIH